MTNKTDIEALRDKYELALKDVTDRLVECSRLNYCMDELTAFAAFSSTVLDQLEAERQRADANEPVRCEGVAQHVHDMIDLQETIDELRAELAALRGKQEPVAWTDAEELRDVEKHGCGYLFKLDPTNPYTDPRRQIPLFTRQPKPVVDDSMALAFHHALNDGGIGHSDLEEIKTGLRAALGFYDSAVVKGGE